jgi:hypothetical protein
MKLVPHAPPNMASLAVESIEIEAAKCSWRRAGRSDGVHVVGRAILQQFRLN